MEKTLIQALPYEILAKIFEHVDVNQLLILARVSSFWNQVSSAEYIWRDRCLCKWRKWATLPASNWKKAYENRVRKEQRAVVTLYSMCHLPEQEGFEQQILDDSVEIEEFVNALIQHPLGRPHNLTTAYFATFMSDRLRQKRICESWNEFLSRPVSEQRLEEGAVLLCQWNRSDVQLEQTFQKVSLQLDQIANRVRVVLEKKKTDKSESVSIETENSEMKVLNALNQVFFREMSFRGNTADYYCPENSFIDVVLECRLGIPISLALVYSCVARRLGMRIDLIGLPGHVMARHVSSSGNEIFIDVFERGTFNTRDQLISRFGENFPAEIFEPLSTLRIFSRMLSNLSNVYQAKPEMLYGVLNQMIAINANDHRVYAQRAYFHIRHLFRPKQARQDAIKALASPSLIESELRKVEEFLRAVVHLSSAARKEQRFRIGDVVQFSSATYTVVAFGIICGRTLDDYEVLFDFGTASLPWSAIELVQNSIAPIPQIAMAGKYFQEFKDGKYIANEYIKKKFPDG